MSSANIEQLSINTIRTLAMDAIQQAKSGHPGTPMGMAPLGYTLFQRVLRYDPADPVWPNRDRFVLSAGHASMLIYALLHLTEVQALDEHGKPTGAPSVSLDEIKRFRQLNSKTPGHPEYRWTAGVETTTGPLGQGASNAVGMAIAGRWLAQTYNRPGFELFNYRVYALAGDGCMMEGITSEAASLAGHLKLGNLCWIYDSNRITIEGKTDLAFSEDVIARFQAYGWNTLHVTDANDIAALEKALVASGTATDRPTLIVVNSQIGFGAPKKQGTKEAHGEPLGDEEIRGAKKNYGWPEEAKFLVPDGVLDHFRAGIGARGKKLHADWETLFNGYKQKFPEQAAQLECLLHDRLPEGWDKNLPTFPADEKGIASRDSSGKVLNAVAQSVPWLIGGSADLAPSTKTLLTFPEAGSFTATTPGGRNMHFGIREHAMGAILNGMAVSKVRPYGATFMVFSDYCRPAVRLSAIMELPVIYVFTHDSIAVGEDGPTHEPVEHVMSLRLIPGLITLRPADANEVVEAWRVAMTHSHEPIALALTRQALPTLDRTKYAPAAGLAKGAYVLQDAPGGKPDVILIGTGSALSLCVQAAEKLQAEGVKVRIVSMPSWELFEKQPAEYRNSVFPAAVKARVSVEEGVTVGWDRYVGPNGTAIGMHSFGASGPMKDVYQKFGLTTDAVVAAAKNQIASAKG
ncbi:MAG: transketolase [Planctomycetes bacterium]|nr:transketolase [Planctomycetota bacterium]